MGFNSGFKGLIYSMLLVPTCRTLLWRSAVLDWQCLWKIGQYRNVTLSSLHGCLLVIGEMRDLGRVKHCRFWGKLDRENASQAIRTNCLSVWMVNFVLRLPLVGKRRSYYPLWQRTLAVRRIINGKVSAIHSQFSCFSFYRHVRKTLRKPHIKHAPPPTHDLET